ncbi:phospho-N-acetylmuramoyl-pentapeptide-transferase [Candidatus Calescamantes bacterium]|nr:phospho-N-acetylmuramoyl-pentapeptide-transferase [Candidatus Calescamantes bacterium]
MFYHFLYPLKEIFSPFNIFRYLTFRSLMAIFTSFIFALLLGPWILSKLKKKGITDFFCKEGCEKLNQINKDKIGTPTMGGILVILSFLLSLLLWGNFRNPYVLLVIGVIFWLAILGYLDDSAKIKRKSSKGLTKRFKLLWQTLGGVAIGIYLYYFLDAGKYSHALIFPFFKNFWINWGVFYILFVTFYFVGVTNAVNITDGLDGLAIGCYLSALSFYSLVSYLAGNVKFANYLLIPYVPGAGELMVLGGALLGAGLGFLWFNSFPAEVFMGDVGSMALGGALATIALVSKQEFLIILVGGVFIMEILSVVIQVISYRLFRRRVFLIAPLHHHFQYNGFPETKITIRLWIISIILTLLAFSTLKIR